jgi:hypothetical protein
MLSTGETFLWIKDCKKNFKDCSETISPRAKPVSTPGGRAYIGRIPKKSHIYFLSP